MPNLRIRNRQPELMDQPGLDVQRHEQALRGLARINWISRSNAVLWPILASVARSTAGTIRVLDIASGSGDTVISIAQKAKKNSLDIEVSGCDISDTSVQVASRRAKEQSVEATFFLADALNDQLPNDFDIVMCSLFLHHLDEQDAVNLLRTMADATRQLVIVNDLMRSRLGYWMAYFGTRLLSRSTIVHTDGPLSVRAAFRTDEVLSLAARAGLNNAQVTRHWPQRFLFTWNRIS